MQIASANRKQTMVNKFTGANLQTDGIGVAAAAPIKVEFPNELYVFQKDSKTISVFNIPNQQIQHKFVEHKGNFPHNF
jgi:hypothetical protein